MAESQMNQRSSSYERGQLGEKLAESYLREKGYRILARNFRAGRGEIDLIAQDGEILVFVEVKSSTSSRFGEPEDRVDWRKQNQIRKVAQAFLISEIQWKGECRFDVIGITYRKGEPIIQHILDAFWVEP
jgi:putative endonuclease